MKSKSFILLLGIVVVFAGLFFYLKKTTPTANPPPTATTENTTGRSSGFQVVPFENKVLVKSHSPVKGSEMAKVTVVEFLDPECEACAAMYPHVERITKEFQKDLRIVVRYMTYHGNSKYVANILEGARAENKFWEALGLLFTTQSQWADHHNPKPELIPEILKPLGLDLKKIIADAKAGKYDQQISEDMEDGKKIGVQGTPTFFVNGAMLEELGPEPLRAAIQRSINP